MVSRARTLSRTAVAAIVGAGVLLTLVAAGALWQFSGALEAGDWARQTLQVLRQIGIVRQRVTEAETGQRGFVLTDDPAYREQYEKARSQIHRDLEKLSDLTAHDPEHRQRLDALRPAVTTKLEEMATTVAMRAEGDARAALELVRTGLGRDSMDQIRARLEEMAAAERDALQARLDVRTVRGWWTAFLIVLGNALALLGIVGAAWLLTRLLGRALTAEALRRESESRLYVTLRSIGDAVIATDARGGVIFLNPAASSLTGWSETEARGVPLADVFRIVDDRTGETAESPVDRVIREGRTVGLANHTLLVSRDGRAVPIDDSGAPIRDAGGDLVGVVLVFRDVTERNRAEETSRQALRAEVAREQAERANEAKDSFLAVLSHELRSPLSAMLGWTRLLQQDPENAAIRERAIAVLDRNIQIQANLINDLLDVSRIVSGKFEVERAPVDLVDELTECLDALQPLLAAKRIRLTRTVGTSRLIVHGDAPRLTQMMRNLVDNAIKFTPEGGRIEVELDVLDGDARFSVTDSGEGFRPELASVIFRRFEQGSDPRSRQHGGLGLGLAIVREIVAQHGGGVTASSAGPGQGARFVVRLPVSEALDAPEPRYLPDEQKVDLRGVRILVVEDDADWRTVVSLRLQQRGAAVTVAGSVPEALDRFDGARPQVVVSDLGMPRQDGFELLREIRKRGEPVPRMVAMTGFADASTREECRRSGFDHFLAKPFEPGQLVVTIGHLLVAG